MRRSVVAFAFISALVHVSSADPIDRWQRRTSGTGLNLASVAHGADRFVAVGQWGAILVSSNGADWVAGNTTITQSLYGVAFGAGQFVAVGDEGVMFTSPDGLNWTIRDSATTNQLKGVRWLNDRFIATGGNGTLLSSPDGFTWTPRDSGSSHTLNAVVYGNSRYVAVGSGNSNPASITVSTDGITWSNQIVNFLPLYDVTFGHDRFIALGVRGRVYISTNAADWQELFQTVDTRYLFGIIFVHGRFVAVGGEYGGGSQKIVTSPDGFAWTLHPVNSGHSGTLRDVVFGNSSFVAVGDKGLILQSDSFFRLAPDPATLDGRSWTFITDPNRSYHFQCSTNVGGPWKDITNFVGNGEAIVVSDPDAAVSSRFYRVASP